MKTIFRNTLLAVLALTAAAPLISMQWPGGPTTPTITRILPPAPWETTPVIARISNHMEDQKAMITFGTSALLSEEVEPQTDLILGSSLNAQNPQNAERRLMATNRGFTLRGNEPKIFIATPAGIAIFGNIGFEVFTEFKPYSSKIKNSILEIKAKRVRVLIDAQGFISLIDDEAKPSKAK